MEETLKKGEKVAILIALSVMSKIKILQTRFVIEDVKCSVTPNIDDKFKNHRNVQ